eukprot:1844609-Alexandrium_andersonii.AAC.1
MHHPNNQLVGCGGVAEPFADGRFDVDGHSCHYSSICMCRTSGLSSKEALKQHLSVNPDKPAFSRLRHV